jgi:cation/acetate symporter
LAGGYGGLTAAVVLVVMSKSVWVTVLGYATPLFPYDQPALFAMPLAFLLAYVFSVTDKTPRAAKEREAFADQWVRAQTGFGADGAVSH